MALSLANFIRISLLQAMRGLADVNTSALALFTDEVPIPADFGTHRVYLSPEGAAQDFGSDSATYRLANKVFAQPANVLSGKGFLLVIPRDQNVPAQAATIIAADIDLTALPDSGALNVAVGAGQAADITFDTLDKTSIETLQASLNTAAAASGIVFALLGGMASAEVRVSTSATGAGASVTIGAAAGVDLAPYLGIAGRSAAGADAGLESLKDAILRTSESIPYFGIISTTHFSAANKSNLLAVADTVQAMNKLFFAASAVTALITDALKQIKDMGYTHTRCLYYSRSSDEALDFMAAYASRALSCNFSGSNTAFTMHGKDLTGLQADIIDQTTLQSCQNCGVDTYPDFGIPKVFTSGANMFYDQIYNRLALMVRLQIAMFNYLVQTDTKIPQTEIAMDGLKGAARKVLAMFVTNGVLAPGAWNSSTVYGDPADHIRNIKDFGYYIYSLPLSQQAQSEREQRTAPLIQIAAKESGAIHSSDLSIYVEA